MEVGMIDPRLNETVIRVAEMDVDAAQEDIRRMKRSICCLFCPALVVFLLFFPFLLIVICVMYSFYNGQRRYILSGVEQTQAYITDSTFVLISPHLPIERARTTVPLANIVTVTTQGHSLWVNIKPTAPEVAISKRTSNDSTYMTRSIPVEKIKNASHFADAIREHITA